MAAAGVRTAPVIRTPVVWRYWRDGGNGACFPLGLNPYIHCVISTGMCCVGTGDGVERCCDCRSVRGTVVAAALHGRCGLAL